MCEDFSPWAWNGYRYLRSCDTCKAVEESEGMVPLSALTNIAVDLSGAKLQIEALQKEIEELRRGK